MLVLLHEVGLTCSERYRGLRGVRRCGEGLSLLLFALRNFTADITCE